MGKTHVLYLKALDFKHARDILDEGYRYNIIDLFDFADRFTDEEKKLRLRDAYYNGEIMEVVLSIPIPSLGR